MPQFPLLSHNESRSHKSMLGHSARYGWPKIVVPVPTVVGGAAVVGGEVAGGEVAGGAVAGGAVGGDVVDGEVVGGAEVTSVEAGGVEAGGVEVDGAEVGGAARVYSPVSESSLLISPRFRMWPDTSWPGSRVSTI